MPLTKDATARADGAGSEDSLARGRLVSGKPNPVDVYVGGRLRARRVALGLTQGGLGKVLGLTFQQVQKYERGSNRISASRLWDISSVLGCPVDFFFEEMDTLTADASPRKLSKRRPGVEVPGSHRSVTNETIALVEAYYTIPDVAVRRRIYELAFTLAAIEEAFTR